MCTRVQTCAAATAANCAQVHVGNKLTPAHPEYGLDQAPARYIEPYLDVANVQRRNLSGMVAAM
jgi:hypothetical protein